ncbi:1,2-phenylacetyl-CoA epoxidase subunit PaaD [Undibacterium sp. TJN19]|uniref:1,2-phenylacetyl-CoA epoxidase subunit PaaD n=1 Tax=Undibacterium sp. TJN19 TaxID=3413055 RepID=UPI003BF0DF5E
MVGAESQIATFSLPAPVSTDQVWQWLAEVSDPEIPVVSVTDLGIIRAVEWHDDADHTPHPPHACKICVVTITPTYSGCPAMDVIASDIRTTLQAHGIDHVNIVYQLSPAWNTDWMTETGKKNLRSYGIAPPQQQVINITGIRRHRDVQAAIICPQCGSADTQLVSQFGSTSCKALYKCKSCLEPFDYFKPH